MSWRSDLEAVAVSLSDLVQLHILTAKEADPLQQVVERYPIRISPHLIKRIKETGSNGLMRQFIPDVREITIQGGWQKAFFSDEVHPTKALAKKYPNRVIIYLTHNCGAFCRHCNRKSLWRSNPGYSRYLFDQALSWIRNNKGIEEVILTGGDPLTLGDSIIDYTLRSLRSVAHVKMLRIGTRAFTSFPARITEKLCSILRAHRPIVLSSQFNHPDEFSQETELALDLVQGYGISVLNQITLLKDVNDNYSVLKDLLTKCVTNGVHPYYMFHCFKVEGALHFRTTVSAGVKLIDSLIGRIGGWWIPRYCLIPHSTGVKVPLTPNPVLQWDEQELILKDFLGREISYE